MNQIGSFISSILYADANNDEENTSSQNVVLITAFCGFLVFSYGQFLNYRYNQRLNESRIKELTFINNQLKCNCNDQERKTKKNEEEFKKIVTQLTLILTDQHRNLSK